MKLGTKSKLLCALCLGMIYLPFCRPACAQPFSMEWHKVAGGGGSSSGGTLSLSGTIGQPDAGGPLTGGSYSLTGGFWVVGPDLVPPTLTITVSGNTVSVCWPAVPGWILQQTSSLTPPVNWVDSSGVTTANGMSCLTLTAPSGSLFFRLRHQ